MYHTLTRLKNNLSPHLQVGGLGVKDYSGRQPNQEQLDDVACKSDPKPGFSFVLENFAELLDDNFLQNLTAKICQGTAELHKYTSQCSHMVWLISFA